MIKYPHFYQLIRRQLFFIFENSSQRGSIYVDPAFSYLSSGAV